MHKWMFGPVGTGFLYVRMGARDQFTSPFGPEAVTTGSEYAPPGTADFPVRAALATSLAFVERLGLERVEARCRYHLAGGTASRPPPSLKRNARDAVRSLSAAPTLQTTGKSVLRAKCLYALRARRSEQIRGR